MNRHTVAPLVALSVACGDTGREHFDVPLSARGTAARDVRVEGATLRLSAARVAVGPLYLCATESAEAELCETALAEWLDVGSFDALSAAERSLGQLEATTGDVRSGLFDYGISWLLTRSAPQASKTSADGHSAVLSFEVHLTEGTRFSVRAAVDIEPLGPGDAAVNALRTSVALGPERRLTLTVDPNAWLVRVRAADLAALDADGDGAIELAPGDQAYEAIVQGMTVNDTPDFAWSKAR